jgi:hypothetical protein
MFVTETISSFAVPSSRVAKKGNCEGQPVKEVTDREVTLLLIWAVSV